jgi:hypothetical protein
VNLGWNVFAILLNLAGYLPAPVHKEIVAPTVGRIVDIVRVLGAMNKDLLSYKVTDGGLKSFKFSGDNSGGLYLRETHSLGVAKMACR